MLIVWAANSKLDPQTAHAAWSVPDWCAALDLADQPSTSLKFASAQSRYGLAEDGKTLLVYVTLGDGRQILLCVSPGDTVSCIELTRAA